MSNKNILVLSSAKRKVTPRLDIGRNDNFVRAREPVKRTVGRVVGYFPSTKNHRQVAWESQLEQKACHLFEFSTAISSYREQPRTIYFESQGVFRRYTPDFELTLNTGEVIYIEIKPLSKLKNLKLKTRLNDISNFWKLHGYRFVVLTDDELNLPSVHQNLKILRGYIRHHFESELATRAQGWLRAQHDKNLGGLIKYIGSPARAYSMIAQGIFLVDLRQPLSFKSMLSLPENLDYETFLFSCRTAPEFEKCPL